MQQKILIVTDFYKPHLSGVVTYISQLVETYQKLNFSVTILTTLHDKNLKSEEVINNIKIIRCKPALKSLRGFYSISLVLKYIKIYKNYNYINIHFPLTEIFPLIFFLNKKIILNYHCLPSGNYLLKFIDIYFYLFGIISLFVSRKILVLSKDYFENIPLYKIFKFKVLEVPPYIKESYITKKIKSPLIKIGYLGRICEEKGLENLIEASNILIYKNINHKVFIAGDLKDERFKKYISGIISKSKNNKNIIFLGKIDEEEKINFYNDLDIFVLPSINSYEAFGIVQLEAMSYGVPVIASNIKGVRSVIQNTGNGLLFMKNNHIELSKKIIEIRDRKFKDRDKISIDTISYYGFDKFLKRISKMFEFI